MPRDVFGPGYQFLQRADLLTYEEIARLTRIFIANGVEKIRLTGGEPLVRRDLDHLIALIAPMEGLKDLTLTTNGSLLRAQAARLKAAGLQRVTVSLDSMDDAVFQSMNDAGVPVSVVLDGIDAAIAAGLSPIKINAVVKRGVNDHTVVDLARHFKGYAKAGVPAPIVRFIEYMDVGATNGWQLEHVVTGKEIVERINAELPIEPASPNYRGEVARRWRYRDGSGEIGVITSISEPFCGNCTRARLSPEGELFTCLFGTHGHDFRALLRNGATDEQISEFVGTVWRPRNDRYSEIRSEDTVGLRSRSEPGERKVEMSHIGG